MRPQAYTRLLAGYRPKSKRPPPTADRTPSRLALLADESVAPADRLKGVLASVVETEEAHRRGHLGRRAAFRAITALTVLAAAAVVVGVPRLGAARRRPRVLP